MFYRNPKFLQGRRMKDIMDVQVFYQLWGSSQELTENQFLKMLEWCKIKTPLVNWLQQRRWKVNWSSKGWYRLGTLLDLPYYKAMCHCLVMRIIRLERVFEKIQSTVNTQRVFEKRETATTNLSRSMGPKHQSSVKCEWWLPKWNKRFLIILSIKEYALYLQKDNIKSAPIICCKRQGCGSLENGNVWVLNHWCWYSSEG